MSSACLVAFRGALVVCATLLIGTPAAAQNTSLLTSRRADTTRARVPGEQDPAQIAVPVAASSDLGNEGQRGVAPTVGFQIWQKDRFFIGAFFTLAATDPSVTEGYGGFVLNPPLKGRSFYVAGNRVVPVLNDMLRAGVGGRWGATSTTFEFTPPSGTVATRGGFATFASITAEIASKSFPVKIGDNDDGEFQLGVEIGPTWRLLGGDLSQDDAFRRQVLGSDKSSFAGYEFTFFVRVNSVQPFARFSSFSRPAGVAIHGLTGRQLVWGINIAASLFQTKVEK